MMLKNFIYVFSLLFFSSQVFALVDDSSDMPLPEEKPFEETFSPSPTEIDSPYLKKSKSKIVAEDEIPLPEEKPFEETFSPSPTEIDSPYLKKSKSKIIAEDEIPLPEEKPFEETFTPSPTEIDSPYLKKSKSKIIAEDEMPLPEEKPYEETQTPSPTEIYSPYLKTTGSKIVAKVMPLPEKELSFKESFSPSIIDKYLDVLEENKSLVLNFSKAEIQKFVGQTVFSTTSLKRHDFLAQAWIQSEKEHRSWQVRFLLFITCCKNGLFRDSNKTVWQKFFILNYLPICLERLQRLVDNADFFSGVLGIRIFFVASFTSKDNKNWSLFKNKQELLDESKKFLIDRFPFLETSDATKRKGSPYHVRGISLASIPVKYSKDPKILLDYIIEHYIYPWVRINHKFPTIFDFSVQNQNLGSIPFASSLMWTRPDSLVPGGYPNFMKIVKAKIRELSKKDGFDLSSFDTQIPEDIMSDSQKLSDYIIDKYIYPYYKSTGNIPLSTDFNTKGIVPIRYNTLFFGKGAKIGANQFKTFKEYAVKRCRIIKIKETICTALMSSGVVAKN